MIMSKSEQDLKDAFAGESQANRKYLAFAKKADQEGFKQVAKLFRAAAEAETVHAHNHLRALGGIKGSRENLDEALNGEVYEFQKMYPAMIEDSKKEANKQAEQTFTFANEVEKIHAALYKKAIEDLGKNVETDYYVCQVCGNTVEGSAPDKCPICGAPRTSFKKME
jgi:rubrerythrin